MLCLFVLSGSAVAQPCISQPVAAPGKVTNNTAPSAGYALFSPGNDTHTYLMDKTTGTIVHTWTSKYLPGMAVYLLPNGNLLRAEDLGEDYCGYPGGRIAVYDSCSNVIWSYAINSSQYQQTHDVYPISETNVLVDVWEKITNKQAAAAGRDTSNNPFGYFWSGMIVELQQSGDTAIPVWQWRFWDHLVSDSDSIALLPQRLNVNYLGTPNKGPNDWIHMNAVAYNPKLDQIIVSSRNLNEFYIIEHTSSTTISAGHSGGKYGMGGDFLYRWGCPSAYNMTGPQQLFGQHSPYWLDTCSLTASRIMINNDGFHSGDNCATCCPTTVNIITAPVIGNTGKYVQPQNGTPFGPTAPDWTYTAPDSMRSCFEGSAQLLPNGNTLICSALQTAFYEVNTNQQVVWTYVLNFGEGAPFRVHQYESAYVAPLLKGTLPKKPKTKKSR